MVSDSLFHDETMVPKRLMRRLDALLTGRVAVVAAPAGHNKSALVRAWLDAHPDLAAGAQRLVLRRGKAVVPETLEGLLATAGQQAGTTVVWLDNHDSTLHPAMVRQVLDAVEGHPRLRLVLSGRCRPHLPLGGLALRGLLVELGPADMALTRDEAAELFARGGGEVPSDQSLADLRGWPIAVELFATAARSGGQVPDLSATIAGYLDDEVLGALPDEDRSFLADISVLPELSPAAARHLSGRADAPARLSRLVAEGIPLEWRTDNHIRLNPMLRRHLNIRLQETDPDRMTRQRRTAADWLQRRGLPREAIALAASHHDDRLAFELTTDLVIRQVGTDVMCMARLMEELTATLPPSPLLALGRTLMLSLSEPATVGANALTALRGQFDDADPQDRARFYGVALNVARSGSYASGDGQLEEALAFAAQVASGDQPVRQLECACLLFEYAVYHFLHGNLGHSRELLKQVVTNARAVGMTWLADFAHGVMALLDAILGRAGSAARLGAESLRAARDGAARPPFLVEFPLLALALVALDRGDVARARALLDELSAQAPRCLFQGAEAVRLCIEACVLLDEGDPAGALAALETYRRGFAADNTPYVRFLMGDITLRARVLVGDLAGAARELTQLEADVGAHTEAPLAVAFHRACLNLAGGRPESAYTELAALVDDPEQAPSSKYWLHLLMAYAVAASQLGDSPRALAAYQRAGVLAERLGLNAPGARHTRAVAWIRADEVSLTQAEEKVLRQLESGSPLCEVAAALFISSNTLKTHLRRIYRKLGVGCRGEAIERARALGIL